MTGTHFLLLIYILSELINKSHMYTCVGPHIVRVLLLLLLLLLVSVINSNTLTTRTLHNLLELCSSF